MSIRATARDGTLALGMIMASLVFVNVTLANTALTLLTADGQAHQVTGIAKARLMRQGTTEGGRGVLLDEYAVVSVGPDGLRYSMSSPGYAASSHELKRLSAYVRPVRLNAGDTADRNSMAVRQPGARALVVQHQLRHSNNSRFTPPPSVSYEPQRMASGELNQERGFAVVNVGESGRVLGVELLSVANSGNAALREAISRGIKVRFQDERRHDHTVYMAYEVSQETVTQLGQPIVIVPECCGPEPPCDPICP